MNTSGATPSVIAVGFDGSANSLAAVAGACTSETPIRDNVVVVGSKGGIAHAGLLLASTRLQLAERSRIPVVIVPTPERP